MLTNVFFSYVAISEKSITSLSMIVAMDSIAAGIVGTVNIAFLTSLVSKKYTGFQYALLTGFMDGTRFCSKRLIRSLGQLSFKGYMEMIMGGWVFM